MADTGAQMGYVIMGIVEQLRAKGILDAADIRGAAQILASQRNPIRPADKAEALEAAIKFLEGLAG